MTLYLNGNLQGLVSSSESKSITKYLSCAFSFVSICFDAELDGRNSLSDNWSIIAGRAPCVNSCSVGSLWLDDL